MRKNNFYKRLLALIVSNASFSAISLTAVLQFYCERLQRFHSDCGFIQVCRWMELSGLEAMKLSWLKSHLLQIQILKFTNYFMQKMVCSWICNFAMSWSNQWHWIALCKGERRSASLWNYNHQRLKGKKTKALGSDCRSSLAMPLKYYEEFRRIFWVGCSTKNKKHRKTQ